MYIQETDAAFWASRKYGESKHISSLFLCSLAIAFICSFAQFSSLFSAPSGISPIEIDFSFGLCWLPNSNQLKSEQKQRIRHFIYHCNNSSNNSRTSTIKIPRHILSAWASRKLLSLFDNNVFINYIYLFNTVFSGRIILCCATLAVNESSTNAKRY